MPRLLALFLLLAVCAGCDSATDDDVFAVTLFGTDGDAQYTGELRLTIDSGGSADDPGEVTGRWQLEGVGAVPDPNPAAGLVFGSTSDGQIELSLAADVSDSGFNLAGTFDGDRVAGAWATITIGGPVPRGTFVAVRG